MTSLPFQYLYGEQGQNTIRFLCPISILPGGRSKRKLYADLLGLEYSGQCSRPCLTWILAQIWLKSSLSSLYPNKCLDKANVQTLVAQIIPYVKEEMKKNNISEQTVIGIIWSSVMSTVEWNKKEELVAEQAIKHLKV